MAWHALKRLLGWHAIAVAALFALTLIVGWYGWIEPPYLSYQKLPLKVIGKPRRGEPIVLEVRRCNSDDEARVYLSTRTLVPLDVGMKERVLAPGLAEVQPGCNAIESNFTVLPKDLHPGRWYVRGYAEARATFRTVLVPWYSEPFVVE